MILIASRAAKIFQPPPTFGLEYVTLEKILQSIEVEDKVEDLQRILASKLRLPHILTAGSISDSTPN